MERLTYDDFTSSGQHCWQVKGADNALCKDVCEDQGDNGCKDCPIAKAFDRLAAYEDTELEPEEVEACKIALMGKSLAEIKEIEGIPVERMKVLAKAEAEGRLLELPCKVGNKVYQTDGVRVYELTVRRLVFDTETIAFDEGAIGESIYLTREEAEEALKGAEE